MSQSCSLDIIPFLRQAGLTKLSSATTILREQRRQVAKRLSRKRLLENNNNANSHQARKTKTKTSVYRTSNSERRYKSCTFLGDNDIILAIDTNDFLDIVRLDYSYNHSSNGDQEDDNIDDSENDDDESSLLDGFPLPMNLYRNNNNIVTENNQRHHINNHQSKIGKSLCTNFKVMGSCANDSCAKIQSFQNDSLFVAGMESGDMKTYSIERLVSSSCNHNSSMTTTQSTCNGHYRNTPCHNHEYIQCLSHCKGPKRRYERNDDYSIGVQIQNSDLIYNENRQSIEWIEVLDDFLPASYCFDSSWDFQQTSYCSTMSQHIEGVHVNRFADAFYLLTSDSRQQPSTSTTGRTKKSHNHNAVCIDVDMNGSSQLTGVCYLSDNLIATSFDICEKSRSSISSSCIKLWDTRYMKRTGGTGFTSHLMLESYKSYDAVFGLQSEFSWSTMKLQQSTEYEKAVSNYGFKSSEMHITRMSALDYDGNLLVSLTDHVLGEVQVVIDPIKEAILAKFQKPYDLRKNVLTPNLAIQAVNQQHGMVAFYSSNAIDSSNVISVVNPLNKSTWCDSMMQGKSREKGLKRKKTPEMDDVNRQLPPSNTIHANTRDRDGLQTELSYLAFNKSGTKLAGVSIDGDIYVW